MTDRADTDSRWTRVQRILFAPPPGIAAGELYARREGHATAGERGALTLHSDAAVSLATYFGAFPLGYWSVWGGARAVRMRVTVEGWAEVSLFESDPNGSSREVSRAQVTDGTISLEHVSGPVDGGWLWARLRTDQSGAVLSEAVWEVPERNGNPAPSRATIAITTFNRTTDCLRLLETLADDEELLSRVDRIVVIDQGTENLRDAAGFQFVSERLGRTLAVLTQPNLGGSGGFSRGMLAAAEGPSSHVLLLDDDVVLEPESVLRMLCFADHARLSVLVGAQMLSLTQPSLLHSFGERVDDEAFWWLPVDPHLAPADLVENRLESTPELHRVAKVDFNGWWMCLVPTEMVRRIGAALPLFIKWDDAEYGLRAAAAGCPTVTLPGAALWHMPWTAKDDGLDWQAYFQLRNRLVAALVHSTYRRGGRILSTSLAQDVNHILCMQYGSSALRRLALRDVLSGPDHLVHTVGSRVHDARVILQRAGQVVVTDTGADRRINSIDTSQPTTSAAVLGAAACAFLRQLRPSPAADAPPEVTLPRELGKWWVLGRVDSAVVGSATGTGSFVARRNRRRAVALLRDAVVLRVTLWLRWPTLAARYRSEAPRLASATTWRRIIADSERTNERLAPSR